MCESGGAGALASLSARQVGTSNWGPAPGPPQQQLPQRMLRVEYQGQPFDWFNLDEIGEQRIRNEEFIKTLRENIVHYFKVPVECQALYDEEGVLATSADLTRALLHHHPLIRVGDLRDMTPDLKEKLHRQLALITAEVVRFQMQLGPPPAARPVSPWPVREPQSNGVAGALVSSLADRLATPGSSVLPPAYDVIRPGSSTPPPPYAVNTALGSSMPPAAYDRPRPGDDRAPWQPSFVGTGQIGSSGPLGGSTSASVCNGPLGSLPTTLGNYDSGGVDWQPKASNLVAAEVASQLDQLKQVAADAAFNAIDRNHDGVISCSEFTAALNGPPASTPGAIGSQDGCVEVALFKEQGNPGVRYGFANIPASDGRALLVSWVDPSGLLGQWNRANPSKDVREGDVIIRVNTAADDVEAMRLQLQLESIRMLVRRQQRSPGASAAPVAAYAPPAGGNGVLGTSAVGGLGPSSSAPWLSSQAPQGFMTGAAGSFRGAPPPAGLYRGIG